MHSYNVVEEAIIKISSSKNYEFNEEKKIPKAKEM